ncbi:helix-turn-helix transcriptional regulator [Bosea sp. AS-1]|uniref:helix-turn-helix transcriptional regulator n=1 Tax=Bosea sp. AS-1 TaxID=2015316 RepID=UPI000B76FC52|nr:helix-turn-helix transcriptional regulator [Bosea sp. AS-1]
MRDVVSNHFLQDVICRFAEPGLLIDSRRQVVFATESFERLAKRATGGCACEDLLATAPTGPAGTSCCWDMLDDYLACGCDALWPIQLANGGFVSTICKLGTIDLLGEHGFMHLRVRPLGAPSQATMQLFEAIRQHFDTVTKFQLWATEFFRATWGVWLEWFELDEKDDAVTHAIRSGLGKVGWDVPFDISLQRGRKKIIRRVFANADQVQPRVLLISTPQGELQEELVSSLRAVVRLASAPQRSAAVEISDAIRLASLSLREREVLALLYRGLTDASIAERLQLSTHTVKNHVRHIMSKCGAHKRIQLAMLVQNAS